jgi:hypothetical protein
MYDFTGVPQNLPRYDINPRTGLSDPAYSMRRGYDWYGDYDPATGESFYFGDSAMNRRNMNRWSQAARYQNHAAQIAQQDARARALLNRSGNYGAPAPMPSFGNRTFDGMPFFGSTPPVPMPSGDRLMSRFNSTLPPMPPPPSSGASFGEPSRMFNRQGYAPRPANPPTQGSQRQGFNQAQRGYARESAPFRPFNAL